MKTILTLIYSFFLSMNLSCKTKNFDEKMEKEKDLEKEHAREIEKHFNSEAKEALHLWGFDVNEFIADTFAPEIKRAIRKVFEEIPAQSKPLKDLSFYPQLTKYFPPSLLEKVVYLEIDKMPTLGEIFTRSGINRTQLERYGFDINNEVWNFRIAAMTLGYQIFISKSDIDVQTFFHECVHVVQYDHLGSDRFLSKYAQGVLAGVPYRRLLFEETAYFLEGEFASGKNFDAYTYTKSVL